MPQGILSKIVLVFKASEAAHKECINSQKIFKRWKTDNYNSLLVKYDGSRRAYGEWTKACKIFGKKN